MYHPGSHLRGEVTLGTYLLNQEGRARFLVLDADDPQGWERLGHLARGLAVRVFPRIWREAATVATCGCFWPRQWPEARSGPLAWGC